MIRYADPLRLGGIQDDLDSDLPWAAFDACPQDGLDERDASTGVDVTSFKADGWHRMDDRDVETPWWDSQPSAVPVFFHPTERAVLRELSLSAGPPSYLGPTCGDVFFGGTVGAGSTPEFTEEIKFYDVAAMMFPGGLGLRVSRPRVQRRSDENLMSSNQRRRVAATGGE
jgi:hypothetical protein